MKAWDCCVIGNSFTMAWRLHATVLLLLVLLQISNMSQNLSASDSDIKSIALDAHFVSVSGNFVNYYYAHKQF